MSTPHAEPHPSSVTSLMLSVYLPALLFSTGWGMVIPVTPLFAKQLGASLGMIGFVMTMKGLGTLLFDLPAGLLVARVGTRRAMIVASFGTIIASGLTGFVDGIAALALLSLALGGFQSVWMLSRNAHLRLVVATSQRGRAISSLGGAFRVGSFLGPIIGGFIGRELGLAASFFGQALVATIGLVLIFATDRSRTTGTQESTAAGFTRMGGLLRSHARVFLTGGLVTLTLGILRSARLILLPLWGSAIGLNVAEVGLVMGLGSGLDMLMFFPAGLIMDRLGRKWAMIPCLLILSLSFVFLPLAHSFLALLLVSLLAGLGNGFGAGIVMTLGADFAPSDAYGEFLGIWRLVGDVGTAGGPAVVGIIAQAVALAVAPLFAVVSGVAGAVLMGFFTKETRRSRGARARPAT